MDAAFYGANNLVYADTIYAPNLQSASFSLNRMFFSATALSAALKGWNVSNVNNMAEFLRSAAAINYPIGDWDVSNVTSLASAIRAATAFNQNIGAWRPKKCTSFLNFMTGKTDANYSAANLAAIYSGWPQDTLANNITTTFNTIKYASSGSAGRAFLTRTAATVSVSNATDNGGLIQITTSAAHGRTTGDFVFIDGVGGVPNATGGRTITVIDSTNFTIDGSTFAGSYLGGGNVHTGRGWTITDGGL
jgi:hypothetical protein